LPSSGNNAQPHLSTCLTLQPFTEKACLLRPRQTCKFAGHNCPEDVCSGLAHPDTVTHFVWSRGYLSKPSGGDAFLSSKTKLHLTRISPTLS